MFQHLLKPIAREFSGKRAWLDVCQLWLYRNTVMTPMLREACRYCVTRFRENGLSRARMVPYKADGKTKYGDTVLPMEWHPKRATLHIAKPEESAGRIADFQENVLSLVCRSAATPRGGVEAPVVVLNDGTKEQHYRGVRVKGKIVLTNRQAAAVASLAKKHGAIGVVTDTIDRPRMPGTNPTRDPEDGPDAIQWNQFGGTEPASLFGFVLSPRIGGRLRRLIQEGKKPVVLRAEVEAKSLAGHSDVVDAVVRGRGDEELWVLAHISEPGAYDNASGCSVSMEIARTLKALMASRTLPPMKRSIRFLFSTEVTGFLPYLHAHREKLPKVVAGLCVDSVGVDMGKIGGEMLVFRSPDHAASFTEHLVAEITEAVVAMEARYFGENNYSLFPWRLADYWGNDAFITDPYFDVPTPQLSCWPYRYYHTSMDVPEFISPDNLARSGVLCAAYLYFLACAGPREAAWLSTLASAKAKTRIADELNKVVLQEVSAYRKGKATPALSAAARRLTQCSQYYGSLEQDAVRQPLRLAPRDRSVREMAEEAAASVAAAAEGELGVARRLLGTLAGTPLPDPPEEADPPEKAEAQALLPRRRAWHEPRRDSLSKPAQKQLAELETGPGAEKMNLGPLWPWANGQRSIYEIWQRVKYRLDCPLDVVIRYFQVMAKAGHVEM